MVRRFVAPLMALIAIGLLTYMVLFNPSASASPQELTVISRTRGGEVLTAQVIDNEIRIRLKNNHRDTITAFAIKLGDTTIKEDFATSGVHFGIEPGDTYEKTFDVSRSPTGEFPTLYLLTVLLKNGARDGNLKVAKEMEDVRLGEKIQVLRTLRILEKEGQLRKDLKTIKSDIEAALNAGELETLITLKELQPSPNLCRFESFPPPLCFNNLPLFSSELELPGYCRRCQSLQETEHSCRWRQEKVAKIVPYGPPFINKLAVLIGYCLSGVPVGESLTTSSSLAIKSTVCFLIAGSLLFIMAE